MGYFEKLSYLALEPNSYCNLHCTSCNRDRLEAEGLRKNKNLTLAELKHILEQVKFCPINTVKLQILSEPMFHPEFHILAKELKSYFPKAYVIVATNLQYNLLKSPFLSTLPFADIFYLSIDGTGEIYEKLRVGARYDKLLKSLTDIKENVSPADRKKLYINFTLTPENYLELPKVYELKEIYELGGVRINLAQNWNEDQLNDLRFSDEITDYLKNYSRDVKGVPNWNYSDCFWPFSGVTIDVYGNVRQCIINTTQQPIGNVFSTPLKEIFDNSPVLQEARMLLSKNIAPNSCKNCDYKHLSKQLADIFSSQPTATANKPRLKVFDENS